MSIAEALQAFRLEPRFMRNVVVWRHIPPRPARWVPHPRGLHPALLAALASRGLSQLYTHQAAAVEASLRGEHVAVVTPAASGKTLCYNLPVLQHLLADPAGRALYLYPTKALAQDQLAALQQLIAALPVPASASLSCATYDGDTSSARRSKVRDSAQIILSNPDMLHAGILPQHTRWAAFFANLRVVVIDEMHTYRGVFGSQVANVLRRLRRICRFYGADPQFVLASATIANPAALAAQLVGAPVTLVGTESNGAPQGEKNILLYNPPVIDPALGIRRSAAAEAAELAAHFVAYGQQTIVFAGSRLGTELLLLDLRERLPATSSLAADSTHQSSAGDGLAAYRGGYLAQERRAIERGLRDGTVRGVVATNALELGIDIGQLGVALLSGYPGTIAGTWQQMGRAGRRQEASLAVLVATASALDQYLIAHPEFLFEQNPEHALVNPDNPMILADHLACAAAELPFAEDEEFDGAGDISALLSYLVAAGELYDAGGRIYWGGSGSPSSAVSLRAGTADRVVIQCLVDGGRPQVIGEVDRFSVPLLLYEGAIYIHAGKTYFVEKLDWEAGTAFVRPVQVDYYTRPSIGEDVRVLAQRESREGHGYTVAWGDVQVTSRATGYRIQRRGSHEVLGFGTIDLPEQVLETTACWITLSPTLIEQLKVDGLWLSDPNEYGPQWPAQRAAARARDGYRCQGCGAAEINGKQHDVHHKIPFRAFVADAGLRPGLPADEAWRAANVLDNLVTLCASCHHRAEAGVRTRSGLGGVAALLAGVAPLHLMCDSRDLGMLVEPQARDTGLPTVTIYEKVPAGIGYAAELFALIPALLRAALDLAGNCPCERGCPGCVGPVLDHDYALDTKRLTLALLGQMCADV